MKNGDFAEGPVFSTVNNARGCWLHLLASVGIHHQPNACHKITQFDLKAKKHNNYKDRAGELNIFGKFASTVNLQ